MKRENCVLIIAGPSGVGKTVVAESLVELDPVFTFLRSATTRAKRGDEHDDEYIYFSEEEFLARVAKGEFAEHMRYGGCLYGTPKSELKRAFDAGKIPLMVLDLVGVRSMALLEEYSACSVYVYTDTDVILDRLKKRYGDSEDGIRSYEKRRLQNENDFRTIGEYTDYIHSFIKNDTTVESCRDKVLSTFKEYSNGAERDAAGNLAVAAMLKKSVE